MDIDFALVLVCLTAACLVIYLADLLWLGQPRAELAKVLKAEYPNWKQEGSDDAKAYISRLDSQQPEPVVVEYAKSFLPVFAFVLVLRSFLFEPFQIPSTSMVPTLKVGDFILVNKFNYGLRLPVLGNEIVPVGEPERGDVMVFYPPNDSRYFIKRVIGLPGDHIKIVNKVLYVNGEKAAQVPVEGFDDSPQFNVFEEDLLGKKHLMQTVVSTSQRMDNRSFVVKPGHYFMMGDNRDRSSDSRMWGQVPEDNIVGEAVAVWMSWDFKSLPSFDRVGSIQ